MYCIYKEGGEDRLAADGKKNVRILISGIDLLRWFNLIFIPYVGTN